MADVGVKSGDKVLLIWTQPSAPAALRQYAEEVGAVAGAQGRVSVENLDRLLLCELPFASSPPPFPDGPSAGCESRLTFSLQPPTRRPASTAFSPACWPTAAPSTAQTLWRS